MKFFDQFLEHKLY